MTVGNKCSSVLYHTCHEPYRNSEVTFDLSLVADNGHLVYQGQWYQEVAKVHK